MTLTNQEMWTALLFLVSKPAVGRARTSDSAMARGTRRA